MARSEGTWKPGQSGNPKGRPKKKCTITAEVEKLLKKRDVPLGEKNISRRKAIAETLINMALKEDIQAIKQLMNYIDGIPESKISLTGPGGGGVKIEVEIVEH